MHLATFHKIIKAYKPSVVVVDPITNLGTSGSAIEVRAMLSRMMDMFRAESITALFTSLSQDIDSPEQIDFGVSSFVDSWLLLRDYETNGERNKLVYVLKSRGTSHSNQVREFVISDHGIHLVDVYLGSSGIVTGSARVTMEARQKAAEQERRHTIDNQQAKLAYDKQVTEAEIRRLTARLNMQDQEIQILSTAEQQRQDGIITDKADLQRSRSITRGIDIGKSGRHNA